MKMWFRAASKTGQSMVQASLEGDCLEVGILPVMFVEPRDNVAPVGGCQRGKRQYENRKSVMNSHALQNRCSWVTGRVQFLVDAFKKPFE